MSGQSTHVDFLDARRARRAVGLWARRVGLVVMMALLAGVVAPTGKLPPEDGPTSAAWLWNWLATRPIWAYADPATPKQQAGRGTPGHYVKTPRMADVETPEKDKAKGELDRYQPHKLTGGARTTASAPRGFVAGSSKRIASAATETSDVYRNADGSYTRRVHRERTNYRAADGTWTPIDSRLRTGADGRPRATANSIGLSFAGTPTTKPAATAPDGSAASPSAPATAAPTPNGLLRTPTPTGGAAGGDAVSSDDLVRFTVDKGIELSYSLAGASIGEPVVDGRTATYRQVFPDTDVKLGAVADGVKEELILHSANVPTEYVYPLRLTGLEARLTDGVVEFVDDKGRVKVSIPPGYLEDSAVDRSGAGAMSHEVRYDVVSVDGAPALKMSIDGTWLRDPARRFPVILDPTARIATLTNDTYVQSKPLPEPDRVSEDNVAVGSFDDGVSRAKALLPFPNFDTSYAGKRITAADLNLFLTYQGTGAGCRARGVNAHRVLRNWTAANVTFEAFPAFTQIGNESLTSTAACGNDEKIRNVGDWVDIPLDVAAVNEWVTGTGNFGLALSAAETDSFAWKRFTSADTALTCTHSTYGAIQCDPFIDITYADNVPPQVDSRYPANNAPVNTLTPELTAQGHDPDNWPAKGLRYNFLVYNDQGTQIATSGLVGGSWKVPAGVLAWGKTYLYAVQANDYSSSGPAAPVTYAFTTQVPQPMITSSLAQNGGKGYEPSAGNYTTSDVDAQVETPGPALAIGRDYNSLDTRTATAFGRGWSSILDMQVREIKDAGGVLQTAAVRYPGGQEVAFGRNNDGVWVAPSGRFAVFKPITGGYSLTDKDATAYEFTKAAGTGVFGITKIADAAGRAVTFRYDADGRIDRMTSVSSGRALAVAWSTPPGAAGPHVASVTTDPATPNDPSTALTWTYNYDNDLLSTVCPPGGGTDCARYEYTPTAQHATTVLNTGPYSFWRLNEPAGETVAKSSVLSNDGTDNATFTDVGLGGEPALPASTSTSASFNGTSSRVVLPDKTVTKGAYQSVGMWFRTTTPLGVLFSYQASQVSPGATSTGSTVPALYIDADGKLRGQLWTGTTASVMSSASPVTDGGWHHVLLSGNGAGQQLYLDGQQVGSLSGAITMSGLDLPYSYVGAGFLGGDWPGQPNTTPTATFFNGSIADVTYFNRAVTGGEVGAFYGAGHAATPVMSKVVSEAGRTRAEVGYDGVSGRVAQVTDENGGVWKIGAPTTTGSSQVYVSSVLGSQPRDYFRLNDIDAPAEAVNQVDGFVMNYNNVTFNPTQPGTSPFADTHGALFDGASSYSRMDGWGLPPGAEWESSVELWFKVPVGHAKSGVLFAYQRDPIETADHATVMASPAVYVGADGYLRGSFYTDGSKTPITSKSKVNDGQWHHVVLSSTRGPSSGIQTFYLDNRIVGTKAGVTGNIASIIYIGAGTTYSWPSSSGNVSYFKGNIAEFAFYRKELTAADVDSHYKASRSALPPPVGVTGPLLTPVSTAAVTDPAGKTEIQTYDLVNGSRLIAQTDSLGNTTSYGFDIGGFNSVVYDPLGRKTETGKDVRGNTVRSTTCSQDSPEVFDKCQTTYYSYWPDATTTALAPDGRNDQLVEIRDARSSSNTDNTYRTVLAYDAAGNRTDMTTPPVPGFPAGRTTTMTYTTAATAAVGGGTTPPGLPLATRSAGGSEQKTEYNSAGDPVRLTDATGLVTEFSYDSLGRVTTKTVRSASAGEQVTAYRYDADGQLVETVEPSVTNRVTGAVHTAKTTDVFDPDGNVMSRTVDDLTGGDSPRRMSTAYNAWGQVVQTVDPAGSVTLFEYDSYGNQIKEIDCSSSQEPANSCPADDVLRVMEYSFDSEGNLLSNTLTGRDGNTTRLTFNAYFADGSLAAETDAMNWTTKYTYWGDNSVRRVVRTDGERTYVVQENSYDDAGNLLSRRENNGSTHSSFKFDAAGRMLNDSAFDRTRKYIYDADDRVVSTRFESGLPPVVGRTIESTYDRMGRVTSESVSTDTASRPLGWWKLDESSTAAGSDLAYDSSPSHSDASGSMGVSLGSGFATFDGGGILDTNSPVLDTTQSYSVSAWVKVPNFNSGYVAAGQGGENTGSFFLQYSKSLGKWAFLMPSSDSTSPTALYTASSGTSVVANTWVHLVGVFDANTKGMALYANGAAGTPGTNPTPFRSTTAHGFGIGGITYGNGKGTAFVGSVDNVQAYQRALSPAEVATLYGSGSGRTSNTTVSTNELTTRYAVNDLGQTTAMTDPMGNTTDYLYDEVGRMVGQSDPSVMTDVFGQAPVSTRPTSLVGYNTFGEQVEAQDPRGNVAQTRVDAAGRPWKTIMPSYTPPGGTPISDASMTTVYDKLGQVVSTTDPRGKTTTYEYDAQGNPVKVTDPAGKVSTAVYDKVGDLIEAVDPTGARSTATYDYLGRKLTSSQVVRQPAPVTNTTTYDYGAGTYAEGDPAAGPWLRKVTSPDGVTASMTYNQLGEQLTVKDGVGNTTSMEYDGLGRLVKTTNPDSTRQTMVYDGAGRVVRTEDRDATNAVLTSETATYDDNGNVIAAKDARGTTTTFTFDATGKLTGQTQPVTTTSSITTSFGYDPAGNQTRFTDGRGNAFWTTYNTWGLPESQIEPATQAFPNLADRTFTVAYDEAGRPTSHLAPGGVRVDNRYDDLNRLVEQTGSGAEATTVAREFGYDDAGRVTSLSMPGGTNNLTYDDRGLPLSVSNTRDSTAFTYTRDGRMASRSDAAGTTTYGYDAAGRFKTAVNPTTGIDLNVTYNTMSLPATITHGGPSGNVRTFTYDTLHRLKTDTVKTAAGTTTLGSITYGYDPHGNETSKLTTGFAGAASNTYTYDLANRLTSWTAGSTTTAYAYDASGNRTQSGAKTFTYDERNQLATQGGAGAASYLYTARGTLRQTTTAAGTFQTTADAFGQVLLQESAKGTSEYQYDALGRAVRPGFAYSGTGNHLAKDTTATYTRGPGGELFGEGNGDGTGSLYAWSDQHRDVVGQFSGTGTALTGSTTYDPLGAIVATSGMVGNLGYQGEWTDALTGRVNMMARWYNTDTGQFDTRDSASNSPVPDSVAANRFQYGDGNPLTTVDPTGHWGWSNPFSSVVNMVGDGMAAAKRKAAELAAAARAKYEAAKAKAAQLAAAARAKAERVAAAARAKYQAAKAWAKKAASKAKKAWNTVKNTTVRWVKKKANQVKDAYHSAKKCLSGGVGKCVKETAKKAAKKAVDTVKSTVEAIKKDPWKFIATAAVGIAAAVAVGALCATGIGCALVVGAVAGAMSSGAGFMVDVSRGDQKFSWSGLASTMIEGGLDGALSAGLDKFTGGAMKLAGKAAGTSRLPSLTSRTPGRPATPRASPGGGGPSSGGSSAGSAPRGYEGKHRAPDCHSFDPKTRVLMADGTTKPIEDIGLGDRVAATDPATGVAGPRQVTRLHINVDRELTNLTVRNSNTGKTTTLKTTQNHPFWDATDKQWAEASTLKAGHRLLVHDDKRLEGDNSGAGTGGGGPPTEITVVKVANYTGTATMRDLTVANIHTYYVIAGRAPVLVHNCGGKIHQDKYSHGGSIRYGGLDANHRPTSVSASLDASILDSGSAASSRIKPPGWPGNGDDFNVGRGHLLARMLGGSGSRRSNLVTLTQDPVNSPIMRDLEQDIYDAVKGGQNVQYTATAVYDGDSPIPIGIRMEAYGSGGFSLNRSIPNPAGLFGHGD